MRPGTAGMRDGVRYQIYESSDGHVLFMASEQEFWKNFCDGVGRTDMFERWPGSKFGDHAKGNTEMRRELVEDLPDEDHRRVGHLVGRAQHHDRPGQHAPDPGRRRAVPGPTRLHAPRDPRRRHAAVPGEVRRRGAGRSRLRRRPSVEHTDEILDVGARLRRRTASPSCAVERVRTGRAMTRRPATGARPGQRGDTGDLRVRDHPRHAAHGRGAASRRRGRRRRARSSTTVRLTYREVARRGPMRSAAAVIAAGVQRGDRVAIWAPNCWEWIVALLGLQSAGAVLVPLNTRYKGAEAADILRRSNARLLFTVEGFLGNELRVDAPRAPAPICRTSSRSCCCAPRATDPTACRRSTSSSPPVRR